MFEKYAINKTDHIVQLIDGKIEIPARGWRGLTKKEIEHDDIIYALRKEWIVLEKKEPSIPASPEKPKIKTLTAESEEFSGEKEPRIKVSKLGTGK